MIKRLSLLNGLAILAVVWNHSTFRGYIALIDWSDRWSSILPKNVYLINISYTTLTVIEKLAVFSVPAFLFFSGFFVAFAARGNQSRLTGKMVRSRVLNLLIPYLIWSIVIFIIQASQGEHLPIWRYATRLLYGGAVPHYYFVPLLIQLYLLSPYLVKWAQRRWKALLITSGAIQIVMTLLPYLGLISRQAALQGILKIMSYWSWFPMWIFFFSFGMVAGFHVEGFKRWVYCYRRQLLASTAIFGALAVVEANYLYSLTGNNWRDTPLTIPSTLYALSFIMAFLGYEHKKIPYSNFFARLSGRTYGIYLIHTEVLGFAALLVYSLLPVILPIQIIFLPLMVIFGVAVPYYLMEFVSRSPARKAYRYLFG